MESKKQPSTDAEAAVQTPALGGKGKLVAIKQSARLMIIVLFLGWLFDFFFWEKSVGVNFALFSTICLLAGLILLFLEGYRPAWKALWLLLPFGFFVVITFVRQEPLTIFLAYTFALFCLGLLASTYLGGRWFQYGLMDYLGKFFWLVGSTIRLPIEFLAQVRKDQAQKGENRKRFPLGAVLRGLVIALPIVACFAALLASADLVFSQKLGDFFELFNAGSLAEYFVRLVLILICAYALCGIFLYASSQSSDEKLIGEDRPVIKPFFRIH